MKTRVLSAIVMILIAFPLLIIGGEAFSVFMALLAVLGLYELIHIRESVRKFPFLIKVYAYLLVIFLAMNNFDSIEFVCNLDYRVMSFVIFAFVASMIFSKDREKYNFSDALFLIGSVLFVGLSFNLMIIKGYTSSQASKTLGISRQAVNSSKNRAIKKLRSSLNSNYTQR